MLHLVRHGRPLVDRSTPAHAWSLDPAGFDAVWALRESGRLPRGAHWFSSPEPKARETAELLTDGEVAVVEGLREHLRDTTEWHADHDAVVRRALAEPDLSAAPGWEPAARCRERVVTAVTALVEVHQGDPLVLVGHATAWALLIAELEGAPVDLERREGWAMPDVATVEPR